MSRKKSNQKSNQSMQDTSYKGYNQNQQENSSFGEASNPKFEDNSNARA